MTLRLDEPFRWGGSPKAPMTLTPHEGMAVPVKAATGLEVSFNGSKPMLSSITRNPRKLMRQAQDLYYAPWVGLAERTVTRKVAGLPWHVEDQADDEVDDKTVDPRIKAVRDLLEHPQGALPEDERQEGMATWADMVTKLSQDMGLCNVSYLYPDQMDQNGIPLALIYIDPVRVTPRRTEKGILVGYSLDADDFGNGGTFLRRNELIPFHLDVDRPGHPMSPMVEAILLKARIVTATDLHILSVLGTGGRIAGLIAPKDGYIEDGERFAQMERDLRNVNDAPDAAKRATLLRGAMTFTKTAADPTELGLLDIGTVQKDDTLTIWGVPGSQAGRPHAAGLNSGGVAGEEYEVFMTGPVHDRVVRIRDTFQIVLLDRYKAIGIQPELVIEEPTFDDEGPAYELASKAVNLPLTNNQRLALVGLDPLPDYGPDGEPLGVAIVLPSTYTLWAQGPDEKATPDNPFPGAPKPKPEPVPPPSPFVSPISPLPQLEAGKAAGFLGLREAVDKRMVPAIVKTVGKFLASQKSDIASRIRSASPRHLKDEAYWWRDDAWDKALTKALRPHVAGIAQTVTTRTADILVTGKAKPPRKVVAAVEETDLDPFTAKVERYVLAQTGTRISGINETTREAIGNVIRAGLSESLTAQQIAERIEAMPAFDEARAELIARTETQFAYNAAAITSFREYGVQKVQAIDGDDDEECASRDGQVYPIEDAFDISDHPNGTLDWAPYFEAA